MVSTAGIQDLQLARVQLPTSEGMRSAEDLALDHIPDAGVTAALRQLPGEFRIAAFCRRGGLRLPGDSQDHALPGRHRDVAAASRPESATRASRGNAHDRRRAKQRRLFKRPLSRYLMGCIRSSDNRGVTRRAGGKS